MSFDKSAIEEANKHLQALNRRVIELDAAVNEKTRQLQDIEAENQEKIQAIIRQKDAEIEKRNAWLESTQAEIRRLTTELNHKDNELAQLRTKAPFLDKVLRYKPDLVGLLSCLAEVEGLTIKERSTEPSPRNSVSHPQAEPDEENTRKPVNGQNFSSEEEVSETTYKPIIWTPKAKSAPTGNSQNGSEKGPKVYNSPTRKPGGAVKDRQEKIETELGIEATEHSDDSGTPPEDSPSQLRNFETQL